MNQITNNFVYLKGNFLEGNLGDDALLLANVLLARSTGFEIVLLAHRSPNSHDFPAMSHARPEDIRSNGVIVYGGGTQFFTPHLENHPDIQGVEGSSDPDDIDSHSTFAIHSWLARKVRGRVASSRLTAMPTAAIGLGIGPFAPDAHADRRAVNHLLGRMELLWVRDAESAAYCRRHEMPHVIESADLCFTRNFFDHLNLRVSPAQTRSPRRVGIILRDSGNEDPDFISSIEKTVTALRSRSIDVDLISFSLQENRALSSFIRSGERVVQWAPRSQSVASFIQHLSTYSLLLSARLHGIIFGAITGTPTIAIGLNNKLRQLGPGHKELACALVEQTTPAEEYTAKILGCLNSLDEETQRLNSVVKRERLLAQKGEAAYIDFLQRHRTPEPAEVPKCL